MKGLLENLLKTEFDRFSKPGPYTEEDVEILKGMLPWYVNETAGTDLEAMWYSRIKVHENVVTLYKSRLREQLISYKDIAPLRDYLYATALDDVPLYVNEIPELARWRLAISK